jgi:hypothetical protein
MNIQRETPPFSTIRGTTVQLGARDTIAIYRWDGLSWVARFRDGCGELSDAASWFRVHAGLLRSCRVGSVAAVETVEILTPEMMERIGRLHREANAQRALRTGVSTTAAAAFRRACAEIASTLYGWSAKLTHRGG